MAPISITYRNFNIKYNSSAWHTSCLKKILKTALTIRSKESQKMDSKKLECRQCHQTEVLRRDAQTGMWELMVGYAAISNSSWQYLEETWLDIKHRRCQQIPAVQVLRA